MKTQRRMLPRGLVAVLATLVTLAAALAITATAANAVPVTRTWTGGGATNNWTDPGNWGGTAPLAGDDLVFPAGAARTTNTNNFVAGTAFRSIRFTGSGAKYVLLGNQVALGAGGLSMTYGDLVPDVVTVALPIKLTVAQSFTSGSGGDDPPGHFTYSGGIDLGGYALTFYARSGTHLVTGPLSGTGPVVIGGGGNSACRVIFAGINTSRGFTTVNRGCATFVNGDYSARTTNVTEDGLVAGKGTLGALTALSRAVVQSASDTGPTSILTVNGALSLRAGSAYFVNIDGPAPGTGYGQLVAKSTVTLRSALNVEGALHPVVGQTFTILSNQGGAAISGTFDGLPEGAAVRSAVGPTYRITYKGGVSGRDVVLTALSTGVTRIWTGAGTNDNWTQRANWQGGVAPKAGDDLLFPAGAARRTNVNSYPTGTHFHSMSFGDIYSVSGNGILLGGTDAVLVISYATSPPSPTGVALSMPIVNAGLSVSAADGNSLYLGGPLDLGGKDIGFYGRGGVGLGGPLTGAGRISDFLVGRGLSLNSGSTDAGTVEVHGALTVNGSYGLRSVTMDDPSSSPTVTGAGTVGPFTVGAGTVRPSNTLTVNGRLSMTGSTIYETQVGSIASRVAAKGSVVLNGALLRVVPTSFVPVGTVYTILSNEGGAAVSGTFGGLPEGSIVLDTGSPAGAYRISYQGGTTGRDVTLSAVSPTVLPEADVSVTQVASPDPVAKGDKARFQITVANNGPVAANVSLHDRIPDGTRLVSMSQLAGWSCRTGTGTTGQGINCTHDGELAPGSTQTFTLVVRVVDDAGATIANKATVKGDVADPNMDNNTSVAMVAVA